MALIFFVGANGVTQSFQRAQCITNYEEWKTSYHTELIIIKVSNQQVIVCGNDVEYCSLIFLLAHYQEIDCLSLYEISQMHSQIFISIAFVSIGKELTCPVRPN